MIWPDKKRDLAAPAPGSRPAPGHALGRAGALPYFAVRAIDPDLGLRAARRHVAGDAGTFYYVVSSSPTVRDAMALTSRYIRLVNDALDVDVRCEGNLVFVYFENAVILPRAAMDYQLGSFFNNHLKEWLGDRVSDVTVHFGHQMPSDLTEYERTFAPATVNFNAPFVGFRLEQEVARAPVAERRTEPAQGHGARRRPVARHDGKNEDRHRRRAAGQPRAPAARATTDAWRDAEASNDTGRKKSDQTDHLRPSSLFVLVFRGAGKLENSPALSRSARNRWFE